MGCIGCALIAAAVTANQSWLDRHFLPAFFISRATFVMTEWVVRVVTGMIGLTLAVFARRKIACALSADWTRVLATLLAVVLAFGTAEWLLRRTRLRAAEEVPPRKEPLRYLDARLGWLFVPSHMGYQSNNGRRVHNNSDPSNSDPSNARNRVRSSGHRSVVVVPPGATGLSNKRQLSLLDLSQSRNRSSH